MTITQIPRRTWSRVIFTWCGWLAEVVPSQTSLSREPPKRFSMSTGTHISSFHGVHPTFIVNALLMHNAQWGAFAVPALLVPLSERKRMFTFSPRVRAPSTSFTQLPRGSFCEIDAHWISFGRVTDLREKLWEAKPRNHVKALKFAMSNLDMSTYK